MDEVHHDQLLQLEEYGTEVLALMSDLLRYPAFPQEKLDLAKVRSAGGSRRATTSRAHRAPPHPAAGLGKESPTSGTRSSPLSRPSGRGLEEFHRGTSSPTG